MQLSDVHLSPILNRESLVRVVEQTLLLKPNLVVITGDLIDGVIVEPFLLVENGFIVTVKVFVNNPLSCIEISYQFYLRCSL